MADCTFSVDNQLYTDKWTERIRTRNKANNRLNVFAVSVHWICLKTAFATVVDCSIIFIPVSCQQLVVGHLVQAYARGSWRKYIPASEIATCRHKFVEKMANLRSNAHEVICKFLLVSFAVVVFFNSFGTFVLHIVG